MCLPLDRINVISVYIGTLLEGLGMKPVEQLALIAGMITSKAAARCLPGH
jgi:hypothetical protein